MSEHLDWNEILDKQAAEGAANISVEGKYPVIVIESDALRASSGNWMIKLRCRVTEGVFKDKDVWTNVVLATGNEVAMKFTLRKLKALGITREYLRTHNPTPSEIAAMVKGAEAVADIGISQFEGEATNEIKGFAAKGATGLGGVQAPVPSPPVPDPAAPPRPPMTADEVPPPPVPEVPPPVPAGQAAPAAPPVPQPEPEDKPVEEPF
jgi:hypothetical protein